MHCSSRRGRQRSGELRRGEVCDVCNLGRGESVKVVVGLDVVIAYRCFAAKYRLVYCATQPPCLQCDAYSIPLLQMANHLAPYISRRQCYGLMLQPLLRCFPHDSRITSCSCN